MRELNIGHFLVGEAIFIGFESNMALAVGLSFVLLVASVAVLLFAWLLGDRVEL